jgi:RNA polymerase sigma factor (sigma-70 family)
MSLSAVSLVMRRTREPTGGPSDESLIAGMAHGDERAGLVFVRRYQARVFGLALGMVGDAALAEDIAQEALVRVWRHAPVYDPRRGAVPTWVLTIARNLTIDALRMRRAVPTDPDDLINLGLVSNAVSPEDAAVSAEAARGLHLALAGLSTEQRRAVVLAYFYGMTAAEISEAEAIPLGTAKTRIRAGLTRLRETMTSEGNHR